ncbi:hypothetical protein D3C74_388690 [compost metagenome]
MAQEPPVDRAQRHARLAAHACAVVEHLDAREARARVDEQARARRLARQARPARAERDREPAATGLGEGGDDVGHVLRARDRLGAQQVVRRVVGLGDTRQQVRADLESPRRGGGDGRHARALRSPSSRWGWTAS